MKYIGVQQKYENIISKMKRQEFHKKKVVKLIFFDYERLDKKGAK